MARLNDHYLKLAAGYLFPEISRRVSAFSEANPQNRARVAITMPSRELHLIALRVSIRFILSPFYYSCRQDSRTIASRDLSSPEKQARKSTFWRRRIRLSFLRHRDLEIQTAAPRHNLLG